MAILHFQPPGLMMLIIFVGVGGHVAWSVKAVTYNQRIDSNIDTHLMLVCNRAHRPSPHSRPPPPLGLPDGSELAHAAQSIALAAQQLLQVP